MNNKLEVIGIDHGWSMMKTISQVFVTGVKEITTTPALFGDVLEYEGKFYKVGTVRQEVNQLYDQLEEQYLMKHKPQNPSSTMEMWKIREQAKMQAEEVVLHQIVMKFH